MLGVNLKVKDVEGAHLSRLLAVGGNRNSRSEISIEEKKQIKTTKFDLITPIHYNTHSMKCYDLKLT